ncbi:hypothetical protein [Pseudomonas sp. NPDC099000]|uniref:hypothetical protein n=1 Tax=Pseudomonas sp. NPDC099000 TaxID=3364488 RepID=UPI00383A05D0
MSTITQRDASNSITADITLYNVPYEKFATSSFKYIDILPGYFQATEWAAKKSDNGDQTLRFYIVNDHGPGTHLIKIKDSGDKSQIHVVYDQGGHLFVSLGGNLTLTISEDKNNTKANFDLMLMQYYTEDVIRIIGNFEFISG